MKIFRNSILAILTLLVLSSCEKWLDINYDPNSPKEVPLAMSFPTPQMIVANRIGGNLYNMAGFFVQYHEQHPTASQYQTMAKYKVETGFLDRDYREFYAALNNIQSVLDKAKAEEKWGYVIAGTVLRAYILQTLVDLMDDAPYSEALNLKINQPKYDKGADIYAGLLQELDDALAHKDKAGDLGNTDLYFKGGNIDQWIGFAQAMKLKLLIRQSNIKDVSVAVKALLTANDFFEGDVMMTNFKNETGNRNPWYEIQKIGLGADNHVAAFPLMETLKSTNDARLAKMYTKNGGGNYIGAVPGVCKQAIAVNDNKDTYSQPVFDFARPVYLFSKAELLFLMAEAELRYNSAAAAQTAYDAAVKASYDVWGVTGTALYPTVSLTNIAKQKWFSLAYINNVEAFIEMRRLGYPKYTSVSAGTIYTTPASYTELGALIDPYINELGAGNYLNRLYYPDISQTVNSNVPAQKALTTKMFWQQ